MKFALAAFLSLFAALALGQPQQQSQPQTEIKSQQERQITQPGNNAPVWREVRKEGEEHYTSVKGRETGVLIQSAGETWRRIRNGPVTFYGGWLVLAVVLAILGFYAWKGPVKLHDRPTGRLIQRFSDWERVVHWTVAISFCVLGLSGLIMFFGKHVLLPVIGYTLFGWLTALSKNLHNFIAPVFIVGVVLMILTWFRDNLPRAYDWQWFRKAWAFFARGAHIPSGRFNAGEKVWFWAGVLVLSVIVAWSGVILLFPNFDQTRGTMQVAWIWHVAAALIYIVMSLGHIYMGTIGVEGAYRNMREGVTDETWAREHHSIWYDEVKSGRRAASGGAVPAGAPHREERQQ
jgi:formate dehydrogenase subunit gamma